MAYADYYLCDMCGSKAFYDANLNYEDQIDGTYHLGHVGDMKVLCVNCSKLYKVTVQAKTWANNDPDERNLDAKQGTSELLDKHRR